MKLNWNTDQAGKSLSDPSLKIPEKHLEKVCKRNCGLETCRYIALTALNGHVCVKNTPLKEFIDAEVINNKKWKSRGDNCDGFVTNGKNE